MAEEDGDVQAERNRVESGKADFDVVQLQNLTKIYYLPHKRITAVKNISLGIPAGEVSEWKRLRAPSTQGRETGSDPQSHCPLLSQSLLLSQHNCNGLFCSDLFLPSFALFIDSWCYGSDERLLVTVDYHIVNEDSRICPVAIIHLNSMGDSESGLSACIFPSGKDKSLQLNTHFHESRLKTNSKEKKHSLVMSVQLSARTLTHEKRKDRNTQSTSEIQRKVETGFYLRLCT